MKNFWSKFRFQGDIVILGIIIFLSIISFIAVFSSTGGNYFASRHPYFLLVSIACVFGFYKISYKFISRFAYFAPFIAFLLLAFTIFFGGAKRSIAFMGVDIQTFYLIGFLLVFYISKYIAERLQRDGALTDKQQWWLIGVLLFFCGGIAVTNISTAIILFLTCFMLFFISGMRPKFLLILCGSVLLAGTLLMATGLSKRNSTFQGRVSYYFTQENVNNYGDQMILSKAAIARSLLPTGPGKGVIKNRLSESDTDYIYATIIEEFSVIIGILILFCYILFFMRVQRIARRSEGHFARLLAMGIGFWLSIQGIIHIAVNAELIPATGQTLPFISRGGSSLVISGIMVGILLNISKFATKKEAPNANTPTAE